MRSITVSIVPLYLLAGLAAAVAPDFQGSQTGKICCDRGTPQPDKICKSFNQNSYCCGHFRSDTKRSGKGQSGCDPLQSSFPVGRDVTFVDPINGDCTSGGLPGFVGCAA
ncbi:hypothetical protein M0657_007215 [Pyricularia oryzae]|nr:hypothetical protein M9X92_011498 [Pyricularia oryzae]KAI7919216.1 hypothetical protein M0657_007215 [Pyricularia oryzae]